MSLLQKLTVALVAIVTLFNGWTALVLAGPVEGAALAMHRVEAFSTDQFVVRFRGGEPAVVVVKGDGDTDLDLYVYDENGHLIGSESAAADFSPSFWEGHPECDARAVATL